MSKTLERIVELVGRKQVVISSHGYEQLAADEILIRDILAGAIKAVVVEDYPDYHKGPCVLVRRRTGRSNPSM